MKVHDLVSFTASFLIFKSLPCLASVAWLVLRFILFPAWNTLFHRFPWTWRTTKRFLRGPCKSRVHHLWERYKVNLSFSTCTQFFSLQIKQKGIFSASHHMYWTTLLWFWSSTCCLLQTTITLDGWLNNCLSTVSITSLGGVGCCDWCSLLHEVHCESTVLCTGPEVTWHWLQGTKFPLHPLVGSEMLNQNMTWVYLLDFSRE